VALAFCRLSGGRVFNNSGELDGSPSFDKSTLPSAFCAAFITRRSPRRRV